MSGHSVKITELAVRNANIRSVHITVNDPGNMIPWNPVKSHFVRNLHQFRRRNILKQKLPFRCGEEFAGNGSFKKVDGFHMENEGLSDPLSITPRTGAKFSGNTAQSQVLIFLPVSLISAAQI
jgi:hypothetical protein